eukprot:g30291.t1
MAVSGVVCSSCEIWEIGEKSNVPGNNVCRKCIYLWLFSDHVDCLEQQLDSLRSNQEADRSFRDVVTTKVQPDRSVTTRRGRQVMQEASVAIPLSNRYTILGTARWGMVSATMIVTVRQQG